MASDIIGRKPMGMTKRRPNALAAKEFQKALNQEDLLAEISEHLLLAMADTGISQDQLANVLGKDSSYVDGLVHGFANVTVRELADVFSAFNRIVGLQLIHEDVNERPRRHVVRTMVQSEQVSAFSKVSMTFERPGERFDVEFEFRLKERPFYSVPRDGVVSLPATNMYSRQSFYIKDAVEEVVL